MRLFRRTNHGQQSDAELMALVGRGDTSAFDVLYDRYARRLLRYLQRMLDDADVAEDFLHDIFLKIIERPELYAPGRSFSTWIFSIAHNLCKNEYRRRETRRTVVGDIDFDTFTTAADGIHDILDRKEFARLLAEELEALDDELRTTFLLRHQENFSISEISQTLGCPEGTVKSRLFNLARRLATRFSNYNPNINSLHHEQGHEHR